MQVLRWLIIAVILISVGFVQAQESVYELPALQSAEVIDGRFEENIITDVRAEAAWINNDRFFDRCFRRIEDVGPNTTIARCD